MLSMNQNEQTIHKIRSKKSLASSNTTTSSKSESSQIFLPPSLPISSLPKFKHLDTQTLNSIFNQIVQENKKNEFQKGFLVKTSISEMHRAILIDWLVNVHLNLRLSDECLFLTIKIIDQFLARSDFFDKNHLQILGICSMFLSSKYTETNRIFMEDLGELCQNMYQKSEILLFEKQILKTLNYTIEPDCILDFYDMIALIFEFNVEEYHLGKYMMEISLLEVNLYEFSRVVVALSCAYLVMKINVERHSDYKKCFLFLRDRRETETLMKMCGKNILNIMDKIKSTKQYTGSWEKFLLMVGAKNDKENADVEMVFEN